MYFKLLGKHLVVMLTICEQVNQLFEHLWENKMQSGKHELQNWHLLWSEQISLQILMKDATILHTNKQCFS